MREESVQKDRVKENGRFTVKVGSKCEACSRDSWIAFQGYNRCPCGQFLWIERYGDGRQGVRFRYRQAGALPSGYRGWANLTA